MNNEIGAINKYKYGTNNNKSGTTCCCGCVSIETGTYVAAIVSWVIYMISAIFFFFGPKHFLFGMFNIGFACPCLLVIFAQQARNPLLFVPYLIAGVVDVIIRWFICFAFFNMCSLSNSNGCMIIVVFIVVTILFHSWFYSIIVRGFLAAREVESRRYRPHF
uniref:Vesicle transport protein n=1 Tax=Globodera rostochiensis TaxID=31243 RepID=A0A914I1S5_GLORO